MSSGKQTTIAFSERERRRRRLLERTAMSITVFFCAALIFSVWYTDGAVLNSTIAYLSQFAGADSQASRNAAINCMHPRNRNTPYCQERTSRAEADWQAMSRVQGGKSAPFTLHEHSR